ncbi:hypothetical protein AHMF7605_02840 [Adhaeribacter arboris]|uniref:TonB C-terminal domain-containing protein n=1 Tax=Adhaeribacter arboris TaxID=2072846 RepID=A0A2T2YAM6_9BACT|nr:M56 family metallopeptidase [Adhaeribacter arboris]PSR52536.1 hypothetical protein AHMF7605_02840 [Adhaeribacter arboris]
MNRIFFYLLESGICLLVFYLLYFLLLKRENCFPYNRFYLLLTPLLSFIIPFIELPFLQQPEPLTIFVSEQLAPITVTATASPIASNSVFHWQTGLLLLYAAGIVIFSLRLVRQLYFLYRFALKTRADFFYYQNIPVHKTQGTQPTFSFGSRIFWDNSQVLSDTEKERILLHESVHIRQKHSLDILYLELLRIIFWFNPLLYLFQRALVSTHEFIADSAVLRTTEPDTYASLLAKQVLHRLEFSFGNYFNKSLTLKRMKMIQQTHRRPSKWKPLAALPVLGILLFVLSCVEPEKPSNQSSEESNNSKTNTLSIDNDEIFTFVEQPPSFPGGTEKMFAFLGQTIKYPEGAKNAGLQGMVIARFVVTKTGKITDVAIVQSLNPDADAEAKRVISLMPDWEPGTQDGKPLNVRYTFPIRFSFARFIQAGDNPQEQNNLNKPVFTQVEVVPQFPGGLEKMYSFLGKNMKYPEAAHKAKVEGTVVVQFVVTDEGAIKDVHILKGLTAETNAEALRVIKLMPNWTPGKQNGKPVNVQYTLPLQFSLGTKSAPIQTGYIHWATPLQNNC